jgi:hypothetical protein
MTSGLERVCKKAQKTNLSLQLPTSPERKEEQVESEVRKEKYKTQVW